MGDCLREDQAREISKELERTNERRRTNEDEVEEYEVARSLAGGMIKLTARRERE